MEGAGKSRTTRMAAACLYGLVAWVASAHGAMGVTISESRVLMGTEVRIILCGEEQARLYDAAGAAFEEIERIERLMSARDPGSALSAINKASHSSPVQITSELFDLIRKAVEISKVTDGAFDISIKPLVDCWNLESDSFRPPVSETIAQVLPLVDASKILIDDAKRTVQLGQTGMKVSLGGIAKGHAVDRAWAVIGTFGIDDGIVSAGGDLRAMGRKEDGSLWTVGVKNPRIGDRPITVIPLSNVAVATSGDYERFRVVDGVRYHHILDPKSGRPATRCMSATVLAKSALEADALATAVFVMGLEGGMALLESRPDLEGLIVDARGRITTSSGLQKTSE